jgi:hypothetical protein
MSWDSSVSKVAGCHQDNCGAYSGRGMMFFVSVMSRPAVGTFLVSKVAREAGVAQYSEYIYGPDN